MSYTALVNVDNETPSKLSAFIADLVGDKDVFISESTAHLEAGRHAELLKLFLRHSDAILSLDNEKEIEGCFQAIIATLSTRVKDNTDEQEVIKILVNQLLSNENALSVLRVLVSVFNLLRSPQAKFQVLKATLQYAIRTKHANLVSQFQTNVPSWVANWRLSVVEKRELFLLVADTLFADQQDSRALFFLTQHVATFVDEAFPPEAVGVVTSAIVSAIKGPVGLYKDRNELFKTVSSHTTADSTLVKLIELLRIFCEGTVENFQSFHDINKEIFTQFDISYEISLKSLRLLGLCVLAARNSTVSQVLSYSDIATCLSISEDEDVEEWVVEAISHGLMDASMDQLNKVIVVSRCVRVSFDRDQWLNLQQKLLLWRNSLTGVLEAMRLHHTNQ